jgi:hypothetical protein
MMDQLNVIVVGLDLVAIVESVFHELGLTDINRPGKGMLGNFKLYTYVINIEEDKFISTRRAIMDSMQFRNTHILALYEHGNYQNIYIMKKSAFKTYNIIE